MKGFKATGLVTGFTACMGFVGFTRFMAFKVLRASDLLALGFLVAARVQRFYYAMYHPVGSISRVTGREEALEYIAGARSEKDWKKVGTA